ncbi:MAG: hypothetical protein PHV30_10465 [Candidatus Margulisbacteria bacterium]|nr:hypothetical protein [Candidatus Margulisiibacteriota bacterium]
MINPLDELENIFNFDMRQIYIRAKAEVGYNATRYLQMLSKYGGIETAKKLLYDTKYVSDGFTTLYMAGRQDLTVEALVLKDKYKTLFTVEELEIARKRLEGKKI